MPKTLKKDIFETWTIDGDDATWTLAKKAMIDVDDMPAIEVLATSTGNRLNINGSILATNDFGVGIDVDGADTKIVIGKNADLDATQGIIGSASGLRVVNKGMIDSADRGIESDEAMNLRNSGDIIGDYAVMANGSGKFVNGAHGVIDGVTAGIVTGSGVNSIVINHGSISGGTYALSIGGGDLNRLVNTGDIHGNVQFFDGNDVIDTRQGTIDGHVYGGDGNDVYKIGKQDIDITEYDGDGNDRVYATVSHALADHVETLILGGNKDATGQGNDGNNFVYGNQGDNTISGGDGDDYVGGRAGKDMLVGGDDQDTFVFSKGDDKDTIADFVQGEDIVWITGFGNVQSFGDIQERMTQHGSDTWIKFGNGDRLVLENVDKDDLLPADFSFAEFPT